MSRGAPEEKHIGKHETVGIKSSALLCGRKVAAQKGKEDAAGTNADVTTKQKTRGRHHHHIRIPVLEIVNGERVARDLFPVFADLCRVSEGG